MNDQKLYLRNCLLYEHDLGRNASEAFANICKAYGEDAISRRTCFEWFAKFKAGKRSLEDEKHIGRPVEFDVERLKEAIEEDPRQSSRELAAGFACSQSTIIHHLHAIGKVVKHGKWMPHQLSPDNKEVRTIISTSLLSRAKKGGFFDSILTADEKWIMHDNVERKSEWLDKDEAPTPTAKPDIHGKKVMLCVWWNSKGLVYFELLNPGQTITADLYVQQLSRVDEALRRQGVDPTAIKYLHDNARPHVAKITKQKIEELSWEVLPHAPYSPDLAPSDYHLFRSMQHSLAGKKFKNNEEVQNWTANYFESQPSQFFEKGIHSLRGRWQEVVSNNGEYLLD